MKGLLSITVEYQDGETGLKTTHSDTNPEGFSPKDWLWLFSEAFEDIGFEQEDIRELLTSLLSEQEGAK